MSTIILRRSTTLAAVRARLSPVRVGGVSGGTVAMAIGVAIALGGLFIGSRLHSETEGV